jgi:protoporphyrinogen/coproporphyrinogen III oxidase
MKIAPKKIAILGAGISGLSLAYFLEKEHPGIEITILEKTDRVGGWIRSHRVDGHLLERGPRSIRTAGHGAETLALVKELGLEGQMVLPSADAKRRFIWHEEKLYKLPGGPAGLLFSPILHGLRRDILRERKVPPGTAEDETIHAFFSRRFGERLTERLVDPVVSGIFAGNPRTLSARSCFPRLYEMEQTKGSILRGMKGRKRHPFPMFSFREGMETLPDTLAARIRAPIHFNTEVKSADEIDADQIFSTLPAHAVADIFPELREKLSTIPFATLAIINLVYDGQVLKQQGFGYLVPSKENQQILGCIFDSCIFHEQSRGDETRLTVMMHGADRDDEELIGLARKNLERHLGLQAEPAVASVHRAHKAIPQYPVGHHKLVAELDRLERVKFLGISFRGVSINDCIHWARRAAEECGHHML